MKQVTDCKQFAQTFCHFIYNPYAYYGLKTLWASFFLLCRQVTMSYPFYDLCTLVFMTVLNTGYADFLLVLERIIRHKFTLLKFEIMGRSFHFL